MAGTFVSDTIQDGAGNTVPTTTAIKGSAKAWVNFNGTGGAIFGSYNVSSVTVNGTGQYTINFTNSLTDANYAFTMGCDYYAVSIALIVATCYARTASSISVNVDYANSSTINTDRVSVSCFR